MFLICVPEKGNKAYETEAVNKNIIEENLTDWPTYTDLNDLMKYKIKQWRRHTNLILTNFWITINLLKYCQISK